MLTNNSCPRLGMGREGESKAISNSDKVYAYHYLFVFNDFHKKAKNREQTKASAPRGTNTPGQYHYLFHKNNLLLTVKI